MADAPPAADRRQPPLGSTIDFGSTKFNNMKTSSLAELIHFVQQCERICPRPMEWNDLYEKIGGRRIDTAAGIAWEPMPPLVLSAWNFSNDEDRLKRFHEHLVWAHQRGKLHVAETYLLALPEDAWHHRFPTKPQY